MIWNVACAVLNMGKSALNGLSAPNVNCGVAKIVSKQMFVHNVYSTILTMYFVIMYLYYLVSFVLISSEELFTNICYTEKCFLLSNKGGEPAPPLFFVLESHSI
jgi:hypothetical protein